MKKSKKRALRHDINKRIVVRIETAWGDRKVVSYGVSKITAVANAHKVTTGAGYRTISVN